MAEAPWSFRVSQESGEFGSELSTSEYGPCTATARIQVTATVMLDRAELAHLPLTAIGPGAIVIVGAGQHLRVWPG